MTSKPLEGNIRGGIGPVLDPVDEHERVRLKINEALGCRKALPTARGVGNDRFRACRKDRDRYLLAMAEILEENMATAGYHAP